MTILNSFSLMLGVSSLEELIEALSESHRSTLAFYLFLASRFLEKMASLLGESMMSVALYFKDSTFHSGDD